MVARDVTFWAWPMVNVYNRRLAVKDVKEPGRLGGVLPAAPVNRIAMLTDYVAPSERDVACPDQDVVYGGGSLALDLEPVVVQVPDFGDRFWMIQVVDLRTDSFAGLGAMYGTKPGFYMLVGPKWNGETPKGIARVFHARTSTGFIVPRVFMDDTAADRAAVLRLVDQIDVYPLSRFDGTMKTRDWSRLPTLPAPPSRTGGGEATGVVPEKFFDTLPAVFADAPALPGEETRYAEAKALLAAIAKDPKLKGAAIEEAARAERDLVTPLFEFRNYGLTLPDHWTYVRNGGEFGTDYFTRTAVARSNIFVSRPNEAMSLTLDLDRDGARLNGAHRYTVTFPKGGLPPVRGFWSLTLYDAQHFFAPNPIRRFSVGTRNKDLAMGVDGSLTLYVQADQPAAATQRANWLPAPKDADFSLDLRVYWPQAAIIEGRWHPPAALKRP
jgi:hypothetical protein